MLKAEHRETFYAMPTLSATRGPAITDDDVMRAGVIIKQPDPRVDELSLGDANLTPASDLVAKYVELRDEIRMRELRGEVLAAAEAAFVDAFDRLADSVIVSGPGIPADVLRAAENIRRAANRSRHGNGHP